MIYVATEQDEGMTTAYLAKNKKALKEMGFKWITSFKSEQKAIMWINETYMFNFKEFLYN